MNKILTIVVPVYNEINTIDIVISRLKKLKLYKKFKKQIIIVDDCSTDGTQKYLKKLKKLNILDLFLKIKIWVKDTHKNL